MRGMAKAAGRTEEAQEGGAFRSLFRGREWYFKKFPAQNTLFFRSDQLGYVFPRKEGQMSFSGFMEV